MTLHNANENWFIGKDLGSSSLGLYNSTQPTKFCAQCPAARPIYQPQFSVFLLASYGGTSVCVIPQLFFAKQTNLVLALHA